MTEKKNEFVLKNEMREVKKAEVIELEDPGEINYLWNVPHSKQSGKQIIVRIRKTGSKLAGHYHKGTDPSKKPEKFFLAKGKMKIMLVDQKFEEETFILEQGYYLIINPYIAHQFEVMEDIVLLEFRTNPFDRENQDTHILDDYIFG